ncbi:MAG TPA: class I SAM-dependent methyltransferase, partial [Solirubrobacterales bacterium]|nr:class I SAM-dependent methyltransferase [Solirubrobacterales bacterium]
LEIGAGTGYFSLNLLQAGAIERVTATDISPGMLATLELNAERLGLTVRTAAAEAETLPFEDESFDLVLGHAVLHHIPDLERAFSEFGRVLRPSGTVAFCGEPSRYGDLLAAIPKRTALITAPLWRRLVGASARRDDPVGESNGHALEPEVDVHAFVPRDLTRFCERAGLVEAKVRGEELLASIHGWTVRTLEASADPDEVPRRWRRFAFRSYIALQRLDNQVLEPRLPPQLFYNLLVSARKP